MKNYGESEVDMYWPKAHALKYYQRILSNLLERVEFVKAKIAKLEEEHAA